MNTPQAIPQRERLPDFMIPDSFRFNGGSGSVRKILFYPERKLRSSSEVVQDFNQDLEKLAADLALTMYMTGGVGLAAIQVGEPKRLIVCDIYANADRDLRPHLRRNGLMVFANPKIVSVHGRSISVEEGCLSFPGIREQISRPFSAVITAQNLQGEWSNFECFHLFAKLVLHEIDHLDGRLLIDHVSPIKQRDINRRIRKLRQVVSGK